jgi:hypothetical protein
LKKLAVVSDSLEQDGKQQPLAPEESYTSDRGRALSQHDIDAMVGNWIAILKKTQIFRSRRLKMLGEIGEGVGG